MKIVLQIRSIKASYCRSFLTPPDRQYSARSYGVEPNSQEQEGRA